MTRNGAVRTWAVRTFLLALLGSFSIFPATAQVFNPETFTLPNGLQVVVLPNHRVPVVSHMMWYRVGSADEVAGKTGLAHFLEHLMFKGTPSVPAGQFSKIVSSSGGQDNAFTSSDYTAYYQNVASDKLELVMKMEADRMANLKLDEKSVNTERDVILEERRMRTDNVPSALLNEQMMSKLFEVHPYHNPIIGWKNELEKLSRADALDFYKKWYAPNNAILIVAGDVTAEQVRALAEKYYGPVPARKIPERVRPAEPAHMAPARVTMEDERVQQPIWKRVYQAPSYRLDSAKDSYALEVLAEELGGSSVSRLYRTLVTERGLAVSIGVGYDPSALDGGTFSIYAIPKPDVSMERLEEAIQAELQKVVEHGLSEESVEQAKTRLKAGVLYARDSLQAGAMAFGVALTTGQQIQDVEQWPNRIAAVTAEQVNQAAARLLVDEKNSVTGILLPKQQQTPSDEAARK